MRYCIIILFLMNLTAVEAQISYPRISPLTTIEQNIGLASIKVIYSRPGVRGRKIFGELVPYGRIWRVGANESTKFIADNPIRINGKLLPAGTYAIYAFPEEESWEFVFHSNTTHWGDGRDAYDPDEDVFRIELIPEHMSDIRENFLITFDNLDHNGMDMIMEWEYTRLRIPIKVDS